MLNAAQIKSFLEAIMHCNPWRYESVQTVLKLLKPVHGKRHANAFKLLHIDADLAFAQIRSAFFVFHHRVVRGFSYATPL